MRVKKSIIVPIVAILTGVLVQLDTLGFTGGLIPGNTLVKLWPLLLAAAGFDLLFAQRRLIAALIMLFFGAALLSTQFLDTGWNNGLWDLFVKIWPILLILFGIDMIFSGQNLINAAVIITAVLVIVLIVLTALDIPVVRDLPVDLSKITSIVPNGDLKSFFLDPVDPASIEGGSSAADIPPITSDAAGALSIDLPAQKQTKLEIRPVSGRVSVKAKKSDQFLNGTVELNPKEHLSTDASLKGETAVYKLGSSGKKNNAGISNWDLNVSSKRKVDMNVVLNNGYLKADLRGMNISAVSLENKSGPVDVMTTAKAKAVIKIKAGDGEIRVYIPKGARISCSIRGASKLDYPQNHYVLNGNELTPREPAEAPVMVEITSNRGSVRIIESE